MRISGGTMLGNCATGSVSTETAPTRTIRMAITMATIGRLMKKRYMPYGNPKLQIPNSKKDPNLKSQSDICPGLELGAFLGFGVWCLGFISVMVDCSPSAVQ